MTDINEAVKRLRKWADNVAEIQARGMWAKFASDIRTILDALDAAEHERDEAIHARMVERRDSNVTHQERNELAAAIEKAIAYVRVSWLGNGEPTRDTPAGEIIAILESAPAGALRAVKAETLRQAYADLRAYTDAGAPFGHRPVEEFLLRRADRIEKGEQ